jgi:hypothetical protein
MVALYSALNEHESVKLGIEDSRIHWLATRSIFNPAGTRRWPLRPPSPVVSGRYIHRHFGMFRGSDSGEASRFPGNIMQLLLISAAFPPKSFLSEGEMRNIDVPGCTNDSFTLVLESNFKDFKTEKTRTIDWNRKSRQFHVIRPIKWPNFQTISTSVASLRFPHAHARPLVI